MLYADGDKSKASETLLSFIAAPYAPSDPDVKFTNAKPHLIDVPHSCRLYKTLLQGGHFSQQSKSVVRVRAETFSPAAFAATWVRTVGRDNTRAIAKGGGAFVVAALLEIIKADGGDAEKREVGAWFDKGFKKELDEGETKGKNILLEVLNNW